MKAFVEDEDICESWESKGTRLMPPSPNGCTCHCIPAESRPCIACRSRSISAKACHNCKIGLLSGEGLLCTQCQWDKEDGYL